MAKIKIESATATTCNGDHRLYITFYPGVLRSTGITRTRMDKEFDGKSDLDTVAALEELVYLLKDAIK